MPAKLNGFTETVRELLAVFEAGAVNSEQRKCILRVRVLLGDAVDRCPHENTVYEEDDRLICMQCREDVTP